MGEKIGILQKKSHKESKGYRKRKKSVESRLIALMARFFASSHSLRGHLEAGWRWWSMTKPPRSETDCRFGAPEFRCGW